jgi:hypothetical protein
MNKSAIAQLYFGLGCGIFYMQAAIQSTIDVSLAFMKYGLAKKIVA